MPTKSSYRKSRFKRTKRPSVRGVCVAKRYLLINRIVKMQNFSLVSQLVRMLLSDKSSASKSPASDNLILKKMFSTALTAILLMIFVTGLTQIVFIFGRADAPLANVELSAIPEIQKLAENEPTVLPRAAPYHLEIPAIGVDATVVSVGKNIDESMEVPSQPQVAGWYKFAPTPGEIGPSIIVGHVDSILGPAVFYELKNLQPGQHIRIAREDGSAAIFVIDRLETFAQSDFPTDAVYGNIEHAGLRLITCGGDFNYITRRYSHNVVVYASLVT